MSSSTGADWLITQTVHECGFACPGDADRLDQRVRDSTGLLTAVNFSTGKDMPERHDSTFSASLRVKKNIQEEH
ncbi:hypothetical protein OYC64_004691 [Pagothenia borchgrevinki]|uniref:Uncharacterized protein n=1 Tax=Pagothenia borchgrevinki TaxID=8213 RepID=A0ABD2FZ97_PAGBO